MKTGPSHADETMIRHDTTDPAVVLSRLCHMAVLTRNGKLEEVADQLVLVVLSGDTLIKTPTDVINAIAQLFGIRLGLELVEGCIGRLTERGAVLASISGVLTLAPSARAAVSEAGEAAANLEQEVRSEWFESLGGYDSATRNQLWHALTEYSAHVFLRHGAETAQLLGGPVAAADAAGKPLSTYIEDARRRHCRRLSSEQVREAIEAFFTTPTPKRARYVAQQLTAAFSVYALSVDRTTSAYLRSKLAPLVIFLDTNCLFALLRIDDSPLAELTRQLIQTIKDNDFPFRVCYHPETLAELRRWIDHQAARLLEHRWLQALSRAAVLLDDLGALERLYHQTNAATPVDARTFVSRYDDLPALLASHGVAAIDGPLPTDDVEERAKRTMAYDEYLKSRTPPRVKPYRVLNHDIEVLMAVEGLRRSASPNALGAGAVFLSADYIFWQYVHQSGQRNGVPAVVLPNQLLQLLRPFVPTTEDFDKHFIQTFALPEFRGLSIDYADTTSAVLGYLSTFKDIGEETATRVLTNRLLMDELKGLGRNSGKFVSLVDKALVRDNATLIKERDEARRQVRDRDMLIETERRQAEARLRQAQEEALAASTAERAATDERIAVVEAQLGDYQEQLGTLTAAADAVREAHARLRRRLIVGGRIFAAVIVALAGAFALWNVPTWTHWKWLLGHPHRLGLEFLGIGVFVAGCSYFGDPSRKTRAPLAIGLTLLSVFVTIIDYAKS